MGNLRISHLLLAAFFIKTCFLATYLTPRWAVPDETGHFSYIADIAEGRGFPVLIKAVMDDYTIEDIDAEGQPLLNNIAQHPPLYYSLMAPIYYLGKEMGLSGSALVYLFRCISAFTATGLLFVCFLCGRRVFKCDTVVLLAAIGTFSCIPMFSMVSGGVSSTPLLSLFLASGVYCWIRSYQENDQRFLYAAAIIFSLACITKYTAVPLVSVWFLALLVTHWNPKAIKSYLRIGVLAVIVAVPISLWMLRNYLLYEKILPIYEDLLGPARGGFTFLELFQKEDIFSTLYRKFLSAIGWMQANTGHRITLHMELPNTIQWIWNLGIFSFACAALYFVLRRVMNQGARVPLLITGCVTGLIAITALENTILNIDSWFLQLTFWTWILFIFSSLTLFVHGLRHRKVNDTFFIAFSILGLLLFTGSLLNVIFDVSHFYGNLRAAHGRYFMPYCVLILIGFLIPAFSSLSRWKQWLLGIPLIFQLAEFLVWVNYASTFFEAPL